MTKRAAYPDGIRDRHAATASLLERHASPFSLLVLGGILVLALAGLFGGGKATIRQARSPAATLTVATPNVLRNGLFFETRVTIVAHRAIKAPTLALPPALWRDQTINSTVPAATDERYQDGQFRFVYPALKAGERLEVKIDGQVNPPLTIGTRGSIALLDGDEPIARIPLVIRVLP